MIFEKVQEIIAEQLGVSEDEIELETSLDDLETDTVYLYDDILAAIEEEFHIVIPGILVEDMETVRDLVEYIEDNQ